MRAPVDIGAADVMWFLGGAGSLCSIRWFDKVPPLGIPVWYLSSGAKRTEGPQYIPDKTVLARRRTASEGRPCGDFVSRVVYSEAPEPKRRRITPEEHRVI